MVRFKHRALGYTKRKGGIFGMNRIFVGPFDHWIMSANGSMRLVWAIVLKAEKRMLKSAALVTFRRYWRF